MIVDDSAPDFGFVDPLGVLYAGMALMNHLHQSAICTVLPLSPTYLQRFFLFVCEVL